MNTKPDSAPVSDIPRRSIFDFADVHSHRPGHDRVLSVDITSDAVPADAQQYFTAGVHPWNADSDIDWNGLEQLLADPRVVGIGEAGLDTLRGPEIETQQRVFERQISLSEKHRLPLVIHSVRSNHRILQLHKTYHPRQPWIIHGFRGNSTQAQQLMQQGIHLSLGSRRHPSMANPAPSPLLHYETDDDNTQ